MSSWTPARIPDLSGQTVIVTGANSGIGKEAASELARAGAHVVLACRSRSKAEAAAREMSGSVEVRELDLADLASVRAFADDVEGPVDVLVNNAGVMAVPESRTADGFEMQIGTNHLGHFALTNLLLDRVTRRVVTVSSAAHRIGAIDLDDLNWEKRRYRRWLAYGQAKLANLLFTSELQRRLDAAGSPVLSVAAHPGYASTHLQQHTGSRLQDGFMQLGNRIFAQSAEQGAWPTLHAATDPDLRGNGFAGPTGLKGVQGRPGPVSRSRRARDAATASQLWELSEKLTGVRFPLPSTSTG